MEIKSVFDKAFTAYGKVLKGYDVAPLLTKLAEVSEKPADSVIYVPSDAQLEAIPVSKELESNAFGGLPIEVGYCNGNNSLLNCVEYHRNSEINIPADNVVFLLASLQKVVGGKLDTSEVEAFSAPAGTVVLLYETTLHYAPCTGFDKDGKKLEGFRVIIILPKGTNTDKPKITVKDDEDKLLWANNKWLIAHPDTSEAKQGAFVGLSGKNISVD